MKKFIIFFIIIVVIMTFGLTRSREVNEENVVSENKLNEYRNILTNNAKEYGWNLTEEAIDKQVEEYKEMEIMQAKSQAEGMDLKQALTISLIVSSICSILLFLIYHFKNAYYNELFGNSFGSDNTNENMKRLRRFFFGRWF